MIVGVHIGHAMLRAGAVLRRRWRAYAERRRRLRAMFALEMLSDRTLKDIGVHRSEIHRVTQHGRHVRRRIASTTRR